MDRGDQEGHLEASSQQRMCEARARLLALSGLTQLQSNNIVHQEINPQNLFLAAIGTAAPGAGGRPRPGRPALRQTTAGG